MQRMKSTWKKLPDNPRRIMTFIIGVLLVFAGGLIGPIPGPGGTIFFLLGIAVLATEFTWAERLRDHILQLMRQAGIYIRRHPRLTAVLALISATVILFCTYVLYIQII